MGDPARKNATYEDILALPEHITGEIIDGVLYTQARPRTTHTRSSSLLGTLLGGPFDLGSGGPGGWIVLDEPELHTPDGNVVVPDIGAWRRECMPQLPDEPYLTICPNWVCEVLSPSTGVKDRAKKMPLYLRWGVQHLWLVDPGLRTLEIFRAERERWMVIGTWSEDARLRAEPFDAIELQLELLWAR